MKRIKQFISIILCVSLLNSIPINAAASETQSEHEEQSNGGETTFGNLQGATLEEPIIVQEIPEERTEFSKEFLLTDGNKMISVYEQPIHFQNDKKEWVDFDNSLVSDGKNEVTNKNGNINVNLTKESSEQDMIQLSADNYSVSWGFDGINKSVLETIKGDTELSGNDEYTNLTDVVSEARYAEVYKNVDLQYFVSSAGVKENIILKDSNVQNEFDITYTAKDLRVTQVDDFTLSFSDKNGVEVYRLNAPYMTDSDGKISTQLTLSLVSQNNGVVKVKLSADSGFIESPETKYPVIIDPEITKNFVGLFTMDEGRNNLKLNHGPYYIAEEYNVITMVNNLPELSEGEQVISASFTYDITNGETLFDSENESPIIFNAHKINSINNNYVATDSIVMDYDSVTYRDHDTLKFDLTKLVKDWYAGNEPRNGFIFEANDTIGTKQVNIKSRNNTDLNPSLTIVYKDFKGTENALSYHNFTAGHQASASVSDYLGNLVVNQALYEGTGSRMPVSLSATYNSIGSEWSFSFNQKVTAANQEMAALGYDYIYTDIQGTRHYLKKDSTDNVWYDEDGAGISLSVGESNLTINNGNTQTFALPDNGGMLLSEKDEHNNTITYNYSNGILISITDGAGNSFNVNSSNGVISSIQLPDSNSITFNYSDGLLTKVVFPSGRMSRYSYDNNKLVLIEQADNISGSESVNSKLGLTFTENRVTRVAQYGSDGTEGNYLNFAYGTDNTTVLTDKQGREVTYTFDNCGNRISILNANGFLENSAAEGFLISGSADSFTKNYITESIEHSADYFAQFNGSNGETESTGGSVAIDTETKYFGSNSVKVVNPVSMNHAAFYTGASHEFGATSFSGKSVTFSAYVKTSDIQAIYNDGAVGASLSIICHKSNGDNIVYNSIGITGTENWQRLSVSANITAEIDSFKVCCNIRNASGSAWFDGMQLEEGNAANDLNVLQNADFSGNAFWLNEEGDTVSTQNGSATIGGVAGAYEDNTVMGETGGEPVEEVEPSTYYVEATETSPMDSVITYDEYGNQIKSEQGFVTRTVRKTYEVSSAAPTEAVTETPEGQTSGENTEAAQNPLGNKYIYQIVNVGRAGMMFNVVGEAKADSVPLNNENRTFGIAMNIYYDGEESPEPHYQEFNSNTTKQQTVALSVMPDSPEKVVDRVAFAFVYGYNKNTMTVYNAMLNIATVGYSVAEEASTEPTTEEATEAADETNDDYVDYEVLSETVDKSQPYMSSSSTYDAAGNQVVSKTDEAGNVTEYEYDENGNTTSVIKDDYYVDYSYDTDGNVTLMSNALAESAYTYNGFGNVSAISHNGFTYTFNYDIYNQLISTAIGNVTIASKTYNAEGVLTRTDFANDDFLEYSYDDYGNLVQVVGENGAIARFVYNKKGFVTKAEDVSGNTFTYYQYDFSGNKTGEYRQAEEGDLSYQIGYDSNGNKVEKTSVNGQVKTITSGTNSNGDAFVSNDGVTINSSTDDFGRTTEVKTSYSNSDDFKTLYTYASGSETNSTSNYIHSVTQKHGDNELLQYFYGYDSKGNISVISETTNQNEWFEKYEYDWLNQLTHVVDRKNNIYTLFRYDEGGNLLSVVKSEFDANTLQPTTEISRNVYTYGDNNWKDKLTAFNGQTITYDEMGNPLQYRDGMEFSWENGRQLKTVTQNNTTLTMRYDSNGLRTQKGNIRYYYNSDNNLIAMVNGNKTLFFYFDESGNVTSFSYNGAMYFYVKNWQGDIINIMDANGTVLVRYDYDVFGKITAIKDGSNQAITDTASLAFLNPLRYRGYVYDDETGLYYLQSRYYDPETGRFLNADIYVDTGSGSPLSSNMFAYCQNNAKNHADINGYSAVWLQDTDAVFWQGHTSLLIQEKGNQWWYFYWGNKNIILKKIKGMSLEKLNQYLSTTYVTFTNDKTMPYYQGKSSYKGTKGFNKTIYFHGDFSASLSYITYYLLQRYQLADFAIDYSSGFNYNLNYLLLLNNCMQVCCDILWQGDFSDGSTVLYRKALTYARMQIQPNRAFYGMERIHNAIRGKWNTYFLWFSIPFMFY